MKNELRSQRAVLVVLAAAIAMAVVLAHAFRPDYLNTDTAQYVVTARHLVRGEGLSTSLLYFEDQLRLGQMPTPQTTWPPGYPLLVAVLLALGVPALYAPFIIALLADLLLPLVVFATLRSARCSPGVATLGALTTLAIAFPHVLVLRGLTESTYALLTMLGLLAVTRAAADPERELKPLLWAGAAAAAAFMVRYAGIAYIGALGGFLLVRWLKMQSARRFLGYALVGLIPVATAAALFLRNWWLVRNAYGGPDIARGASWESVLKYLGWGFQDLLGLGASPWARVLQLLLILAVLYLCTRYWSARRTADSTSDAATARVRAALLHFAAWYVVATVVMLGYLGQRRFAELISARYLAPLLPFIVCAAAVVFEGLRQRFTALDPQRWRVAMTGGAAVLALCVIQFDAAARAVGWFAADRKFETIEAALAQPVAGETVRDFLLRQTAHGEAVLDIDGQLLGLLLDRPTIGLSEAVWTPRTWTEAQVHELVTTFDVSVICFFPTLFEADDPLHQHRIFYRDLAAGRVPPWLELAVDTPLVQLYRVRSRAAAAAAVSDAGREGLP